jgi:hypothetical protein
LGPLASCKFCRGPCAFVKITTEPSVSEKYLSLDPSHSKYPKNSPKNSHTSEETYLLCQYPPTTPKILEKSQNPPEMTVLPVKASKAHIFTTVTPISVILTPKFPESLPLLSYAFINTCLLHFID